MTHTLQGLIGGGAYPWSRKKPVKKEKMWTVHGVWKEVEYFPHELQGTLTANSRDSSLAKLIHGWNRKLQSVSRVLVPRHVHINL